MSRHPRKESPGAAAEGDLHVSESVFFQPTDPEAAHLPSDLSEAIKAADAAADAAQAAEAAATAKAEAESAALASAAEAEESASRKKAAALKKKLLADADAGADVGAGEPARLRDVDDAARIKVLQQYEENPDVAGFRSRYKLDAPADAPADALADAALTEAAPKKGSKGGLAIRENMGMRRAGGPALDAVSEGGEDVPVADFEIVDDGREPRSSAPRKISDRSDKGYSTRISGASGNGRKSWDTHTQSGAAWQPRQEDAAIIIDAPGNDRPKKAKKESKPVPETAAVLSGAEGGPESISKNADAADAMRMEAGASAAKRSPRPKPASPRGYPLAAAEAAPAATPVPKPEAEKPARPASRPSGAAPSDAAKAYAAATANERSLAGKVGQALLSPFKAIGRGASNGVSGIGSWIKFQLNRTKDNLFLDHRNDKAGQSAEKAAADKVRLDIAKGNVDHIRGKIREIDDQNAQNADLVTPKIAKKMERDRRELEMRLIDAESAQDKASRRLQKREKQMMYHENKRTQIAQHYEQMVDDRFRPVAEKRDSLQLRKEQCQAEIAEWDSRVASYEAKAKDLEAKARNNPYFSSVFKAQLKEVRKTIDASRKEISKRKDAITGVFGVDAKMIKVTAKLQKWEDRKAMYSRIAQRQGSRSAEESAVVDPASSIEYKDPFEKGSASQPRRASSSAESGSGDQPGNEESAPKAFGYDEWVSQWNALNGSRLRIDADTMFDSATVRSYRAAGHAPFTKDAFAGIIKVFLRKPEVAAMTKVKAKDVAFLAEQALEKLRAKAAKTEEGQAGTEGAFDGGSGI